MTKPDSASYDSFDSEKLKTGILVSHTHWDRAWYLNFEQYRLRLIRLIDRLMNLLDQKTEFRSFTLDGQTVLLEDYLEIKPENREQLKKLIGDGRLEIGPWYILPDLFQVSGESLYRNLQYGNRLCREFRGGLKEGYVPDPFGHIAQMPQILGDFGINSYIFMRGWGEEEKKSYGAVFLWKDPGNHHTLLNLYQREGYFNAGGLGYPAQIGRFDGKEPEPELALKRVKEAMELMEPLQQDYSNVYLFENGFDHMPEQPEIPELIEELNKQMEDLQLRQGTVAEFAEAFKASVDQNKLGTFTGDLQGNADHPILSSVYSTRVSLKQMNHHCQHLLERVAEPLAVWASAQGISKTEDRQIIDHAWKKLLKNHPHDDICGCSVDGVHEDNEVRYRQVSEIADTLMVEKLEVMVKSGFEEPEAHSESQYSDIFVYNPDPAKNSSYVETEVFFPYADGEHGKPVPLHDLQLVDGSGNLIPVEILETQAPAVRNNYVEITWGRFYQIRFKAEVDGMGYHLYRVNFDEQKKKQSEQQKNSVKIIENEVYRIEAQKNRIELIDKKRNRAFTEAIRFEYQPDFGDTYSFGPAKDFEPMFAELIHVESVGKKDTLITHHDLLVPADKDSDELTKVRIKTEIALEEGRIICRISYRNKFKDGRLRMFIADSGSDYTSTADSSFHLTHREKPQLRTPESHPERYKEYPGELDYPTHYAQDFFITGKSGDYTWVAQRGNHEYELLRSDEGSYAAVTLHRSVGYLSVGNGRIRRCQAGPSVPTPGAQCLRPLEHHIAFGFDSDFDSAVVTARQFAHPMWVRELPDLPYVEGEGKLPRKHSLIKISSTEIFISSIKYAERVSGGYVLRLYNPGNSPVKTAIKPGWEFQEAWETDGFESMTSGKALSVDQRSIELHFGSAEIKSILIR